MSVEKFVESAISDNKVAIFSKSWCPYCKKAKTLFQTEFPEVQTKVFELDELDTGDAIQKYLLEKTGQRTVPNVFVNKQHVGGSDDVSAKFKNGQLKALIEQ